MLAWAQEQHPGVEWDVIVLGERLEETDEIPADFLDEDEERE